MSDTGDILKTLPLFKDLDAGVIEPLAQKIRELAFARGEVLFLEGEPCLGLYLVKTGQVRIFKSSPEGREQVLFIAGPGSSFNDVPVFDGGPNPASASALVAAVVYLVPKEVLLALLEDCPVAAAITRQFAIRLRHLTTMVEGLSLRSVVGRLAKLLLDMAVAENGSRPVRRLTQDEMAAMIGSVRDVVGRALKHLEKTGAIKVEGHRILVVAPEKLEEML